MSAVPRLLDPAKASTLRGLPAYLTQADRYYMSLALELAERSDPAPNPKVGALVVRHDRIVGAAHHVRAGAPHAEALALTRAGRLSLGATVYVTLEPCNHFGRTAPCTDALIRTGVKRVVYGCPDPNPFVAGLGCERLRAAGIEVALSQLSAQACELIAGWAAGLRSQF